MTIIEEQKRFLSMADFADNPVMVCVVRKVDVKIDAKNRQDVLCNIQHEGTLMERMFSLWGDNLNACIRKWGGDGDLWVGKKMQIKVVHDPAQHKDMRIVTPL